MGPLGFEIDNSRLKRAGLDYWPYVTVKIHTSWQVSRNTAALTCTHICSRQTLRGIQISFISMSIGALAPISSQSWTSESFRLPVSSCMHPAASQKTWFLVPVQLRNWHCLQDFYSFWLEQQGRKRLLAFSKAGSCHYATPGQHNLVSTMVV